ncbi:16S rRNA (cytosine(967)-C(5))-methyltransferase RsmB, partial [bacterium]
MKGRTGALLALVAIEKGKRAQNALHAVFEKYGVKKKDKALATELTYGVTRWRKRLDYILSHYLKTPLSDLTPYIRNILRIGVYSILFMKTPRYAAVSECVKLAKRYGHEGVAGLVNAVLRRIEDRVEYPEEDIERLSVYYSLPEWIVARAFELFGEDAEKFLIASNGAPPLSIRVNLKKTTPKELVSLLRRSGIKVEKGMYLPYSLRVEGKALETKFMREGLFTVQDESSSFVVELLSPEPGDGILEVCSAPGGKTTHI